MIWASGFSSRTKGATVDRIPWLAAAANPRFTGFSMIRAVGYSPAARRALPSRDALSTTTTSRETSPAAANTEARHRERKAPELWFTTTTAR